MDFNTSMTIAASGLRTQSERMKTISENIANASSTSQVAGGDPYRRKVTTIHSNFNRDLNATLVEAGKPSSDLSDFRKQYDPGNPAADKSGYVKMPNVNSLVEIMDMREAQRSYEANINVITASRRMIARTIEILKS